MLYNKITITNGKYKMKKNIQIKFFKHRKRNTSKGHKVFAIISKSSVTASSGSLINCVIISTGQSYKVDF